MKFKIIKSYQEEVMPQIPTDDEFCCENLTELYGKNKIRINTDNLLNNIVTLDDQIIKFCPFCGENIEIDFITIPLELPNYDLTKKDISVRKLIKTIYRYDCTEREINNIIKMIEMSKASEKSKEQKINSVFHHLCLTGHKIPEKFLDDLLIAIEQWEHKV